MLGKLMFLSRAVDVFATLKSLIFLNQPWSLLRGYRDQGSIRTHPRNI